MKFLIALLALPAVLAAPAELAARQEPPYDASQSPTLPPHKKQTD